MAQRLSRARSRLVVARGARGAEAALLARLDALLAAAAADPRLLAKPVRVIVPSRSLRLHLAAQLVRLRGGAALGVTVQTLWGTALEVLETTAGLAASASALPWSRHVTDLLVRRLAASETELAGPLGELSDGYAAVAATARDLLDAGLEPAHSEAADEALALDGPTVATPAQVARARALVRVAAGLAAEVEAFGVRRTSTLFRRASELLAAAPERALPARALLVHGFADAPGITLDFLEALVRHRDAEVFLDLPADPAAGPFVEPFRERLAGAVTAVEEASDREPAAGAFQHVALDAFTAGSLDAEVRELAVRLRGLLAAGAPPEGVAVVARDLDRYRLPLRHHLTALGVPFSAIGGAGSLTAAGRRAAALRELLHRRGELPADRWLDATGSLDGGDGASTGGAAAVDLRLAFYALGAARLRDVAALDVERVLFRGGGSFALPVRQGLVGAGDEEAAGDEGGDDLSTEGGGTSPQAGPRSRRGAGAPRRRIPGAHLRRAVADGRAVATRLDGWPETARADVHFTRLDTLLGDLAWPPEGEVRAAIDGARSWLEADFALSRDDFQLLLERALEGVGHDPLGGRGGGVQVLTVVEARGRSFSHLFLPGLNRGVFPRTVRQDPLLADELRGVLARVLPDVPIKQRGFDEERYLFAQLLEASPRVTLSWPLADGDGKPLAPSPLVEGLADRLGFDADHPLPHAPALTEPDGALAGADGAAALRPAREHAVLAALHARRESLVPRLAAAIREGRVTLDAGAADIAPLALDPTALAAARVAVLDELDPDRRTTEGRAAAHRLGPFFGFVGAAARSDDPRRRDLFVTLLERLAACPWQVFLERVLGLEPTPDPLEALPGVSPLLVGNLVHAILQAIVARARPDGASAPETLTADAAPLSPAWPPAAELAALAKALSEALIEEDGVPLPGLARALVHRAEPFLAEARTADWGGDGPPPALAAEVVGSLEIRDAAGAPRTLSFKADRVDRVGDRLRLTDYKTGKPVSTSARDTTQRKHLLAQIRTGERLQAVAYAQAGGALAGGGGAAGRYLFLKPEIAVRDFAVEAGDGEAAAAFAAAVAATLGAWDAGTFVPRVVDVRGQDEPLLCSYCAVAEACLRGDSGARARLAGWTARRAEDAAGGGAVLPSGEAALLAVWRLPSGESGEEEER